MVPRRHLRAGFGLLETILVFAIVIGAGTIVFSVFRAASAGSNSSEAVDQVKLVISNLQSLNVQYRATGQSVYPMVPMGNPEGAALRQQVFQGMTPAGVDHNGWPAYQGVWGGSLVSVLPNGTRQWQVQYSNVDADSCPRFVMGVAPMADTILMNSHISVGGNMNYGTVKTAGGTLDTTMVNTLCGEFEANAQYGSGQYSGGDVTLSGR